MLCHPTPLRIVVTSLGNPIRLYSKINAGVPDVDDLQVTYGTTGAKFSGADLSIGDPFRAVGQFLRDEFPQRHAVELPELPLIPPKSLFEIAGVPAIMALQFA